MAQLGTYERPHALTARRVAEMVQEWHDVHGYAPTVRELAAQADRTVSTIHQHLGTGRGMGLLTWEEGRPRTLRCERRL